MHSYTKVKDCLSVCPSACNISAPTGWIFMKFDIWVFENLSRKFKFLLNLTGKTGTLHEDRSKNMIISRSFLISMRNVSDKGCRENQNTRFIFGNVFRKSLPCMRVWKSIVEPRRPQMTIWLTRIACWIPKATNTLSQYIVLIAFPRQQRLHERALMLRCTFIACLVVKLSLWLNWGFGTSRILRYVAGCLVPDVSGQHGCLIFRVGMSNVEWHSTIESGITTLSRKVGHQYSVTWRNVLGGLWVNELFTS
jgi:hypothetical protein